MYPCVRSTYLISGTIPSRCSFINSSGYPLVSLTIVQDFYYDHENHHQASSSNKARRTLRRVIWQQRLRHFCFIQSQISDTFGHRDDLLQLLHFEGHWQYGPLFFGLHPSRDGKDMSIRRNGYTNFFDSSAGVRSSFQFFDGLDSIHFEKG